MIDQHQQRRDSVVPQVTLKATEIEIVALMQLIRFEQMGNDHHVDVCGTQ